MLDLLLKPAHKNQAAENKANWGVLAGPCALFQSVLVIVGPNLPRKR